MKTRIFVLLFLLAIFWGVWQVNAGVATDYIFWGREELGEIFNIPYTWRNILGSDGMGQSVLSTLWSWPVMFIYGGLAKVGLNFSATSRLFGFLPIILIGIYSIDKLIINYGLSAAARFAGSLVYLANTYIILLIDGGQIFIALAYAGLPLGFYYFRCYLKEKRYFVLWKFSSLAVLISFFDPRVVIFLILLCFLEALFENSIKYFLKTLFVAVLAIVGIHMYWILPALIHPDSFSSVPGVGISAEVLNFVTIGHSLNLFQPHWHKNVFGKIVNANLIHTLVPFLALLAPIVKKKSKGVAYWLLVLMIGVFFSKGVNPPLGEVYRWMSMNISGFWLFRDSTKFYLLIALSYSVLIAFTTEELSKRFNWPFKTICILFATYFLLLTTPVWGGKMTGYLSSQPYSRTHKKVAEVLEKDSEFGRVLWIPSVSPLSYSSPKHPQALGYLNAQKRPFLASRIGRYEVYNYLREAPHMGELFDIAGFGYIAYPYPDTRRGELKQDNIDYYDTFLDQLTDLPWIEGKVNNPPIAVLKAKKNQDHLFVAENTWLVVGTDRIHWDLVDFENFVLSKNALIFAEEKPGLGKILENNSHINTIAYDKGKIDVVATLIDGNRFIFPAELLSTSPSMVSGQIGWWKRETKDFVWWRDFLQQKYGIDNQDFDYEGGWAISEADSSMLMVQSEKLKKDYLLLARVMRSSRGGRVEFWQNGVKIGEVDTRIEKPVKVEVGLAGHGDNPDRLFEYNKADFSWFEVGVLINDSQGLEIRAEGDINIVNALICISGNEWHRINELIYCNKSEDLTLSEASEYNLKLFGSTSGCYQDSSYIKKIVVWDELEEDEKEKLFEAVGGINLIYEKINSTHYEVEIENVSEPITIAFSETYDPLWELDGQSSYPLYSLINGFSIEKDGVYDIYYSPQKYVLPGLLMSGLSLAGVLLLLAFSSRNKKGYN
jgi:hypothetical protein